MSRKESIPAWLVWFFVVNGFVEMVIGVAFLLLKAVR
jgi:membrane-anchored protein YejM (alkaline phosphatase superfamily)